MKTSDHHHNLPQMERMKEYVEDKDGPRVLFSIVVGRKPQLSPISTDPTLPGILSDKSNVDPSPVTSECSQSSSASSNPSILSRQSSHYSDASTAPSTVEAEQPADMAASELEYILPCLLHEIKNCAARFRETEVDNWCSHNLSHLKDHPPSSTFCVFCDREFESDNALASWRNRMAHIADHFRSGLTWDITRPDFRVLKHMLRIGCISQEDFNKYTAYTERPVVEGLKSHDYVPPEKIEENETARRQQNRVPIVDSRNERRNSKVAKAQRKRASHK